MALLDVSGFMPVDNEEFYVVARCKYEDEYYYANMKIRSIPYDRDIYDIGMIHEPDRFSFYEPVNVRYEIAQYRSDLTGYHEDCSRLDPVCIEWGLKEALNATELFDKVGEVEIVGNGVTADVIMEKATHPCTVFVCVRYHNEDGSVAERTGRLFLNLHIDQTTLGARIQTDSTKVQLYNSTNIVPISLFHVDIEEDPYSDTEKVVEGNIIEASLTDETLNQLFDVLPATEGEGDDTVINAVSIVTKKEALDPANKESAERLEGLLKSQGVKTKINIKVNLHID